MFLSCWGGIWMHLDVIKNYVQAGIFGNYLAIQNFVKLLILLFHCVLSNLVNESVTKLVAGNNFPTKSFAHWS